MNNYKRYEPQVLSCSNCGKFFMGNPYSKIIVCCDNCRDEILWKKSLYVTGTEYYPKPKK